MCTDGHTPGIQLMVVADRLQEEMLNHDIHNLGQSSKNKHALKLIKTSQYKMSQNKSLFVISTHPIESHFQVLVHAIGQW